jgi:hypothetical protein
MSVDVGARNCICANIPIDFKVVNVATGGECHVQTNSPPVPHPVLNHAKFKAFSKATKQEILDVAKRGPKFRPNPFNTLQEVHDQLDNKVQSYLHRLFYIHDIESSEWRAHMAKGVADEIISKFKEIAYLYHPRFLNSKFGHPKLSMTALKLWNKVPSIIVSTDVEKAQHDYAFVCPCRYVALIKSEIQQPQYTIL